MAWEYMIPIVAILSVFVGAPLAIMWGIAQIKAAGQKAPAGDSLSAAELQVLIEDAVADATSELTDRVDKLESRLRSQRRVLTQVAGESAAAQPARLDLDALEPPPDTVYTDPEAAQRASGTDPGRTGSAEGP